MEWKICKKMLRHQLQLVKTTEHVSPRAYAGCKGIPTLTSQKGEVFQHHEPGDATREKCPAGILETKYENPRHTCMLVIKDCKSLNVTSAKISRLKGKVKGHHYRNAEEFRVNIFRNLRNWAVPRKCETILLSSSNIYLGFQLLIFHAISFSRDPKHFEQLKENRNTNRE